MKFPALHYQRFQIILIAVAINLLNYGRCIEHDSSHIEITGILDYSDELIKKKTKKLQKIYEELESDNFT